MHQTHPETQEDKTMRVVTARVLLITSSAVFLLYPSNAGLECGETGPPIYVVIQAV